MQGCESSLPRLLDCAAHARVKLALKMNAIADFIQSVIDDPQFVFCEFDCSTVMSLPLPHYVPTALISAQLS